MNTITIGEFVKDAAEGKYSLVQSGIDRMVFTDAEEKFVYKLDKLGLDEEELEWLEDTIEYDGKYILYDAFSSEYATGCQNSDELRTYEEGVKDPEVGEVCRKLFPVTERFIGEGVLRAEHCGSSLKKIMFDQFYEDFEEMDMGWYDRSDILERHKIDAATFDEFYENSNVSESSLLALMILKVPHTTIEEFISNLNKISKKCEVEDMHWDNICYNGQIKIVDFGL